MRNLHISYGFDQNTPETNLSKTHKKTQNTCNKSAFSCTWITATTAIILSFTYIRGEEKSSTKHIQMDTKNKLKKKCSLACEIFFDLAVQVLGWWGYSHNPCHKGKSERIQTGPKRTTSSQYFASWKTDSAKEFTRSNSHQRQPVKYWFFFIILPCSWNMEPSHRRVGLSLFPPKGAGGIPRVACLKKEMCCLEIIQVSRNTRLDSYSMWRPAKPAMPFKKSITSR